MYVIEFIAIYEQYLFWGFEKSDVPFVWKSGK